MPYEWKDLAEVMVCGAIVGGGGKSAERERRRDSVRLMGGAIGIDLPIVAARARDRRCWLEA